MTNPTFPSRVDAWLAGLVIVTVGLALFQAISVYSRSPTESLISLGVIAFLLVLGRLVGYPCEYTLTPTHLLIRFGVLQRRIAYDEITSVEPSCSVWSAPALSLRRVKVSYAGGFQLVSPKDREHFIASLRQRLVTRPMGIERTPE
jgi:hypothetical protein